MANVGFPLTSSMAVGFTAGFLKEHEGNCTMIFPKMFTKLKLERTPNERPFDKIIGCEDIKRLFRMALDSAEPVHILLSGASASAKTLFLQALMTLKDSTLLMGQYY